MHVAHGIGGAIGMPLAVAVRPEKIYISKERPGVGVNLFSGKVREIAYFGSYTSFIVEAANGRNVVITEPNGSRLENVDITWEDRVFFWWDQADPVVLTQ
jgi:putrescine transport system ATP-binding protein